MTDIPLAKAVLVWKPMEGVEGPNVKVIGGEVPDDKKYLGSFGACNSEFSQASEPEQLTRMLAEQVHLTLNEGYSAREVHEALMVIPEYREAMTQASVIRVPEDD